MCICRILINTTAAAATTIATTTTDLLGKFDISATVLCILMQFVLFNIFCGRVLANSCSILDLFK